MGKRTSVLAGFAKGLESKGVGGSEKMREAIKDSLDILKKRADLAKTPDKAKELSYIKNIMTLPRSEMVQTFENDLKDLEKDSMDIGYIAKEIGYDGRMAKAARAGEGMARKIGILTDYPEKRMKPGAFRGGAKSPKGVSVE